MLGGAGRGVVAVAAEAEGHVISRLNVVICSSHSIVIVVVVDDGVRRCVGDWADFMAKMDVEVHVRPSCLKQGIGVSEDLHVLSRQVWLGENFCLMFTSSHGRPTNARFFV